MFYSMELPWYKINEYLLEVGKEREINSLLNQAMTKLRWLLSFETAIVFLIDPRGKHQGAVPYGIPQQVISDYFTYYSHIHDSKIGIPPTRHVFSYPDEKAFQETEYYQDFVRPNRLEIMSGIQLHYDGMIPMARLMLFRSKQFNDWEKTILKTIGPHLSNLGSNLLSVDSRDLSLDHKWNKLTNRELEIVELLAQGLSTQRLALKLNISPLTVYKHIKNIIEKMEVANRQELIVKILKER